MKGLLFFPLESEDEIQDSQLEDMVKVMHNSEDDTLVRVNER